MIQIFHWSNFQTFIIVNTLVLKNIKLLMTMLKKFLAGLLRVTKITRKVYNTLYKNCVE